MRRPLGSPLFPIPCYALHASRSAHPKAAAHLSEPFKPGSAFHLPAEAVCPYHPSRSLQENNDNFAQPSVGRVHVRCTTHATRQPVPAERRPVQAWIQFLNCRTSWKCTALHSALDTLTVFRFSGQSSFRSSLFWPPVFIAEAFRAYRLTQLTFPSYRRATHALEPLVYTAESPRLDAQRSKATGFRSSSPSPHSRALCSLVASPLPTHYRLTVASVYCVCRCALTRVPTPSSLPACGHEWVKARRSAGCR